MIIYMLLSEEYNNQATWRRHRNRFCNKSTTDYVPSK